MRKRQRVWSIERKREAYIIAIEGDKISIGFNGSAEVLDTTERRIVPLDENERLDESSSEKP